jgi:hypothetical protein
MERRPQEILTTMVIESPLETTSAYLTLVSPCKPNVHSLSKLTTKCVSSMFSMTFSSNSLD